MADLVFDSAERGELSIVVSLWNLGEVFGVLDERRRRRWLSEGEFSEALRMLANEVVKLLRLRALEAIPLSVPILVNAWPLIVEQHLYEADAIQITTCTHTQSDALLSGDATLVEISRKLGLTAFDIVRDEPKLTKFIHSA